MKKLILFLVRRRLGLKKFEPFKFANQKSATDEYFFGSFGVMKMTSAPIIPIVTKSNVSLNWLLSNECEIVKTSDK